MFLKIIQTREIFKKFIKVIRYKIFFENSNSTKHYRMKNKLTFFRCDHAYQAVKMRICTYKHIYISSFFKNKKKQSCKSHHINYSTDLQFALYWKLFQISRIRLLYLFNNCPIFQCMTIS